MLESRSRSSSSSSSREIVRFWFSATKAGKNSTNSSRDCLWIGMNMGMRGGANMERRRRMITTMPREKKRSSINSSTGTKAEVAVGSAVAHRSTEA